MAGKIFISYRRSETSWAARALFERLWREFPERVFIDIEGLSLGIDYTGVIDGHLDGCEVMLAMIGPQWLAEIEQRAGDDEPDWVLAELSRGLSRNIPVVPVLVDGAALPGRKQLPEPLKALRNRHGLELHARFFDDQAGRLVREIGKILGCSAQATSGTAAAVVAPAPAPSAAPTPAPTPSPIPPALIRPPWLAREGNDEFGAWAEFEVKGVVQRLRWIRSGEFWMGSPADEEGRSGDETRHRVRLTQGFWLADTACTQALWQAVLGVNPSHFKGDLLRPVEQVSWDDVTKRFLPELNRLLPGLDAVLPTEAQWEYACRAGTETPFSFGSQITTDQANFDGRQTYGGSPPGKYRQQTVPVKSLPANAWGLFEMHGNVWEWCQDGYGTYADGSAVDPTGPEAGVPRVLRGGSWYYFPAYARASGRVGGVPGVRDDDVGFRVCRASPIGPPLTGALSAGLPAR